MLNFFYSRASYVLSGSFSLPRAKRKAKRGEGEKENPPVDSEGMRIHQKKQIPLKLFSSILAFLF